jgi:hypothetical protein
LDRIVVGSPAVAPTKPLEQAVLGEVHAPVLEPGAVQEVHEAQEDLLIGGEGEAIERVAGDQPLPLDRAVLGVTSRERDPDRLLVLRGSVARKGERQLGEVHLVLREPGVALLGAFPLVLFLQGDTTNLVLLVPTCSYCSMEPPWKRLMKRDRRGGIYFRTRAFLLQNTGVLISEHGLSYFRTRELLLQNTGRGGLALKCSLEGTGDG